MRDLFLTVITRISFVVPSVCPLIVANRDREVVAVGMNIFDRFVERHSSNYTEDDDCEMMYNNEACPCPSCRRLLDSRSYQLAAMTSLYLAIKLRITCEDDDYGEDGYFVSSYNSGGSYHQRKLTFRLQSFAELSRGQFVSQDIVEMEKALLATVRWRVHPPTPMLFVSYLLATLFPPASHNQRRFDLVLHVVRELARYCTELAVCLGRDCSRHPASAVAFAAILESMDLLTYTALPQGLRDVFVERAQRVSLVPPDQGLRAVLRKALWPELIMDKKKGKGSDPAMNSSSSSTSTQQRHPITMARDFGLLDLDRLCPQQSVPTTIIATTPPLSPKRHGVRPQHQQEASPISVRR